MQVDGAILMKDKNVIRNVLVPVDGSDLSLQANKTAVIVAKKTGATVTVLYVIHDVEPYFDSLSAAHQEMEYYIPQSTINEILDFRKKEAKKVIKQSQDFFKEEGVSVKSKILTGFDEADIIIELSKNDYDLIIMGAHGNNEKSPYELGSITKKAIRHTTCPILFAKKACSLSNLLICLDGSKNSINTLDYAVKLAEKVSSKLTLLNVQEIPSYGHLSPDSQSIFEKLGSQIIANSLGAIGKKGLESTKRVEFGIVANRIVEIAEVENHDLIVLGHKGLGIVKQFLLGSVSDKVSHKAKCSVLIFPSKHE
jgi:nucleotide-binding universal stress UspA family protein